MSDTAREYVLGTGADELERLGLQHRLWSDAAHGAWKAAGIGPGQAVLDVGCGPGYASLELAQLVGSRGRVVGVDESAGFVGYLNEQARLRGLAHLRGVVGDVQRLEGVEGVEAASGGGRFDLAYARWVLCFVKDPGAVVAGAARALKPGGRLVIHDYFNYGAMTTAPRLASYARAVEATVKSWRDRGGDPDVAGRLPGILRERGLEVVGLEVHQRLGRPWGEGPARSMWHWPDTWWKNYVPKLVAMGYLTGEEGERFFADWAEVSASGTSYVVAPPVFELIAVKG